MFGVPMWAVYAIAAAGIYLSGFGTGWQVNGWRFGVEVEHLKGEVRQAVAQGNILGAAVRTCNASVEAGAKAGKAAVAQGAQLLEAARAAAAGSRANADRLDQLLAKGTPPGAGCAEAWRVIEEQRMAGASR